MISSHGGTRRREYIRGAGELRREARASWWIWLPLLSGGVATSVAFFYAGTRARRRSWQAAGGAYLALLILEIILLSVGGDSYETAAGFVIILTWLGGFAHALALRGAYVRSLADPERALLEAAEARARIRENALSIARQDPRRAKALGIGRPDLDLSFDGGLVDLNSAPGAVLERLPHFTPELAQRVVAAREQINGFESLADFGLVMKLPAPLLDDLSDRVVFLPS